MNGHRGLQPEVQLIWAAVIWNDIPLSGQNAPCRIMMVHPTVKGAADFPYEIWPDDESFLWIERFGMQPDPRKWRQTKQTDGIPHPQSAEARSIQPSGLAAESRLLEDGQVSRRSHPAVTPAGSYMALHLVY